MTAMTAASLDLLSGGRFRLGLGVSGPQVSEGWHGVRFDQSAGPYPGVRRDRQAGADPQHGRVRGPHTTSCRCRTVRARRSSSRIAPHADRTSRSTWPPSGRRTSSWPGRSPTAGWRCSSRPGTPTSSSARSTPVGPRPARRWTASTWCPPSRWWSATIRVACADPVRAVRRALRRRDGQSGAELLQRAGGPDGLRGRRPPRSRTSTWLGATATRWRRSRTSSSTPPRCSGPVERLAERLAESGRGGGDHVRARAVRRTPRGEAGAPLTEPPPQARWRLAGVA